MQPGPVHTEADLCHLAKEAFQASGKTQTEAAAELGVSQPALAQAINEPQRSLTKLRISIIEVFSPYRVEGPTYSLVEKA